MKQTLEEAKREYIEKHVSRNMLPSEQPSKLVLNGIRNNPRG